MSKGLGFKIALQFTENLIGDVDGNVAAFSVTGKQRKHIRGELIDGDYQVDTITRHSDSGLADNTIVLTMRTFKRFNNVEGDLTVKYDAHIGNLTGKGGFVDSFEVDFGPEDLVPMPNPWDDEYFSVVASAEVDFLRVIYNEAPEEEKFTVSATAEVEHIDITIINP